MQHSDTASLPPDAPGVSRQWVLAGVCAALLLASFWAPILWMVERWSAADSYYSHGPLVPLVALWFIWNDRKRILAIRPERSMFGLACLGAGLLILIGSGLLSVYFTSGFAMILALWGLIGFLLGREAMRRFAFPMFILLFMVPPPLELTDNFSLWLKLRVTDMTIFLLQHIGINSVNDGATIYVGDAVVTVGNACSGLRSLISLIFLGVLFTGVSDLGWLRRIALFAASLPIAIISNVVRVFVLCLAAYRWGEKSIMVEYGVGPVQASIHDASGYLIFIVAFALLYATLAFLSRWKRRPKEPASEAPAPLAETDDVTDRAARRRGLGLRLAAGAALLGITAMASAKMLYPVGFENGHPRARLTPMLIGDWAGQELQVTDDVKAILETSDVIQRNYYSPSHSGRPVQLAVVFSPTNRRVAHPPEICYTAAGWEMTSKSIQNFPGAGPMVKMTVKHGAREDLVFYNFKAGPEFTANYYRHQYNLVRNMLTMHSTSSALVRISTVIGSDESEADAETRMTDFTKAVMPILAKELN